MAAGSVIPAPWFVGVVLGAWAGTCAWLIRRYGLGER